MNPIINAVASLDAYLSTLKLERNEHAGIQIRMQNIQKAIEAGAQKVEDGT